MNGGILELRYVKNKHLTNIKLQYISFDMKKVVEDIIESKPVDMTDYHELGTQVLAHIFKIQMITHLIKNFKLWFLK